MKITDLVEDRDYFDSDVVLRSVTRLLSMHQIVYLRIKVEFDTHTVEKHGQLQAIRKTAKTLHSTREPFVVDFDYHDRRRLTGAWFPYSDLGKLNLTHHEKLHDDQDGWLLAGTLQG